MDFFVSRSLVDGAIAANGYSSECPPLSAGSVKLAGFIKCVLFMSARIAGGSCATAPRCNLS